MRAQVCACVYVYARARTEIRRKKRSVKKDKTEYAFLEKQKLELLENKVGCNGSKKYFQKKCLQMHKKLYNI